MSRMNKKSKIVTGVAVGLAALVSVGAVGLVSKGFKNMDVRDWVDGYKNVLEIAESQELCIVPCCGTETKFEQTNRSTISFKAGEEDGVEHASVMLVDQEGEALERANVTLSSNISLEEDTMAGFSFGYGVTASGPSCDAYAFMLDYDKESELLRVVVAPDYCLAFDGVGECIAPSGTGVYSNSYSLGYYGLKSLKNIPFSVTKTVTGKGSSYEVKVNGKTVIMLAGYDSEGNFCIEDGGTSCIESKTPHPVYLTVYGTEATFREVKWSE